MIGELSGISFSVSREKAPVYTLGSAEPRSFSRGKRGIAGSMIFTSFDRDSLLKALQTYATTAASFQRIGGEKNMHPISISDWDKAMTDQIGLAGASLASQNAEAVTKKVAVASTPYYPDECPPFDVTVSFANEYGQESYLVLYGCEILNQGQGWSIDSILSETACTFVARRVKAMEPIEDGSSSGSSGNYLK